MKEKRTVKQLKKSFYCIKYTVKGNIMLEQVKIININSIDKCIVDFKKGNYQYNMENVIGNVVNPISIYGHNGSGKSSFLDAIKQFIMFMINPVDRIVPFVVNNISFEKYLKSKEKDDSLVTGSMELTFKIEDTSYKYFLAVSRVLGIKEEYLLKDNEIYFSRTGTTYKYKNKEDEISTNDSIFVPLVRILASNEISDSTIQIVYAYLSSFVHVDLQFINRGAFVTSKLFDNTNIFDLLVRKSNDVKRVLKEFKEFPNYTVQKSKILPGNLSSINEYTVEIEDNDNFKVKLPFQMISTGMRNSSILLSLILSVPHNGVIFIDELEMALHPSTIKDLIKLVQQLKIQLVFSSHNTNILEYSRPDQVYFAKWNKGFSTLMRLSEIYPNIRQVNNIEKMYLNSVFDEEIENYGK